MSDDVFQHWKDNRFVIAPDELVDQEKLVVLTDYSYWIDHTDELIHWCNSNGAVSQGMTVVFPNSETLMLFVLRWS